MQLSFVTSLNFKVYEGVANQLVALFLLASRPSISEKKSTSFEAFD
jgi:hypothetical protein